MGRSAEFLLCLFFPLFLLREKRNLRLGEALVRPRLEISNVLQESPDFVVLSLSGIGAGETLAWGGAKSSADYRGALVCITPHDVYFAPFLRNSATAGPVWQRIEARLRVCLVVCITHTCVGGFLERNIWFVRVRGKGGWRDRSCLVSFSVLRQKAWPVFGHYRDEQGRRGPHRMGVFAWPPVV